MASSTTKMSLLRNAKPTLQHLRSPIFNRSSKIKTQPLLLPVPKSRCGGPFLYEIDDYKERFAFSDAVLFWKTGFLNHSGVMEAARGRKTFEDSDEDNADADEDSDDVDSDFDEDDDDDDDDDRKNAYNLDDEDGKDFRDKTRRK